MKKWFEIVILICLFISVVQYVNGTNDYLISVINYLEKMKSMSTTQVSYYIVTSLELLVRVLIVIFGLITDFHFPFVGQNQYINEYTALRINVFLTFGIVLFFGGLLFARTFLFFLFNKNDNNSKRKEKR